MDLHQGADLLRTAEHIILTTHTGPDADGLGAEYALGKSLAAMGKHVAVLNADPVPEALGFLDPEGTLRHYRDQSDFPPWISDALLLILDTNDEFHTGIVAQEIAPRVRERIMIDHHECEQILRDRNLIESDSSSTCEMVFDLIRALDAPIDLAIARALYAGIIFDTGSFVYPKTRPQTFDVARELVRQGVVPYELYSRLYQSASLSSLRLEARILAGLRFYENERVAVLIMRSGDLQESGGDFNEAGGIVNYPLRAERVRVSIFFKERIGGELRCSMRSKGDVNVAHVARTFGGGGHRTAAGFTCQESLERSREKVLEIIHQYFVNSS